MKQTEKDIHPSSHNRSYPWAITASLTVCASLVLALHDATYRPAFVQIAMVSVVAAKEQVRAAREKDEEASCLLPHKEHHLL
ncbi:MAG: hypothetical protein ACFB0D_09240 [Phormidesmis sp.]